MIDLKHKTSKEKAQIKSKELAKVKIGKYTKDGFDIEIIGDIKEIEVNGSNGIELFAVAFKNGKQVGFGKDGTVEIERFRFFNPPVLVNDINGDIIREWTDDITGEIKQRKLRYDPMEAIKQDLSHTIGIVGKDGKNILKGKIGNTTSTFYPSDDTDIGPDETSTWSASHDATTGTLRGTAEAYVYARLLSDLYKIHRYFSNIDTSAIPDIDTISSAIFSVNSTAKGTDDSRSFNVYNSDHSVPIIAGDFDLAGTTAYATAITFANWSTAGYNDFTFLTPNDGKINKTGTTKLSIRDVTKDVDNVAPTTAANSYVLFSTVSAAGTANDPKLVVEHSAPSANPAFLLNLLGVG